MGCQTESLIQSSPANMILRQNISAPLGSLLAGAPLMFAICLSLNAATVSQGTNAAPAHPANGPTVLDERRLFALGMVETGNNDRLVGAAGEVSRYQIHPVVWKAYSPSRDYTNPEISIRVARQHWATLARYFQQKTGRQPDDFDMYVLWNTKQGYYAHKGFSPQRISAVVRDRAQRFVNLVNRSK